MNIFRDDIDVEKYMIATYKLASKTNLRDAAWNLAIGQSIGNPEKRSVWETEEMFENHSCIILENENFLKKNQHGYVDIAFPLANINLETDGISQLLCQLMGGQMDIDNVELCHLVDIWFPLKHANSVFRGPKYGISGIREQLNVYDRPLLGGIVKPKIGMTPNMLLDMVKELVEGGVDFIKEDEIMSNPSHCPLNERVELVAEYLAGKDVIYAACINSDAHVLLERVDNVAFWGSGCNIGVHINMWSGFGSYKAVRDMDTDLFLFFQKSGDRVITNPQHAYHIDWSVVCNLAGFMGVDFIHAGMWGGYMHNDDDDLGEILTILHSHNVMPSLSCGMNSSLVAPITDLFGCDYMATVGGAIHSHPGGTRAGTEEMRKAVEAVA